MGQVQTQSGLKKFTPQEISHKFATKCGSQFSGIELWAFKDIFRRNGKVFDGIYYWTEEDFINFLGIPETAAESGRILYAMVHYLCTFPFIRPRHPPLTFSQVAPTTLTFENVVKVVVLFTGRYKGILTGDYDFLKLLFCAMAYYEEVLADDKEFKEKKASKSSNEEEPISEELKTPEISRRGSDDEKMGFWEKKFTALANLANPSGSVSSSASSISASSISASSVSASSASASVGSSDTDIDEEFLNIDLENISNWYDLDLIKSYDNIDIELLRISPTSLYHIFQLLLAIGHLLPQEPISTYSDHFAEPAIGRYRSIAKSMTQSFDPSWALGNPTDHDCVLETGISYSRFYTVIKSVMPFAFDGLAVLFEHFLFNQRITPSSSETQQPSLIAIPRVVGSPPVDHPFASPKDHDGLEELNEDGGSTMIMAPSKLLIAPSKLPEPTKLMNATMIAQLATFMDVNSFQLYGSLKKLYVGSEAGFSMGSFEQRVFKWNAPTIVLISGYILAPEPKGARERSFFDLLPPIRYSNSTSAVTRRSGKVTYGAVVSTPWKLSPKECFGDNSTALFQLEPVQDVFRSTGYNGNYVYFSKPLGLGFGNLPPKQHSHQNHGAPQYAFGDLSLTLEHALEFGVFRHVGSETFRSSQIREHVDFEDRFAITELEVWGCGADEVLREQARLWAWEEKEALRRKTVNLPKDIEESRALLEMAGLVGGGGKRSGGSV
ncbi:TLD-domain-containing protein [Lipomyces chichibuensis]|uniref:TLD-domain-containing protein n=1 Tax=Lipomyces chichibuensis TaxID=1546026 RepID=UPI003343A13E